MRRETMYLMDVETKHSVLAFNRQDAEAYRRRHNVGYEAITFGVDWNEANYWVKGYFSEWSAKEDAEIAVQNRYGKVRLLTVDWRLVHNEGAGFQHRYPVCLLAETPYMTGMEPVKVDAVEKDTNRAEEIYKALDTLLFRMGQCEVDVSEKLPFAVKIGHVGLRVTRYQTGRCVQTGGVADIPVVAFGGRHIALSFGVSPAERERYAEDYSASDVLNILVYEWKRHDFGYIRVADEVYPDAVMVVNTYSGYVNFLYAKGREVPSHYFVNVFPLI